MSVRIQFDFTDEEWERVSRYISDKKIRHVVGKDFFLEGINRKEGRDKKLRYERLLSDAELMKEVVQHLIDTKKVRIN